MIKYHHEILHLCAKCPLNLKFFFLLILDLKDIKGKQLTIIDHINIYRMYVYAAVGHINLYGRYVSLMCFIYIYIYIYIYI